MVYNIEKVGKKGGQKMASASYLMHYCQCLLPFWAIQIVLAKIEKSSNYI